MLRNNKQLVREFWISCPDANRDTVTDSTGHKCYDINTVLSFRSFVVELHQKGEISDKLMRCAFLEP